MKFFGLALLSSLAVWGLDITGAVVVAPKTFTEREQRAVKMLVEEAAKRSQITWRVVDAPPASGVVIHLLRGSGPAEGYRLTVAGNRITISGNDERGVLYGAGRFLREMRARRGTVEFPDRLDIVTAPETRLRGHQLGYRPKTNSYDGWTLAMWEQYIRDLLVFGANAIELIPPRSDDDADSPHFPLPQMQTMIGMSRLADEYGLDVWIWYPALDPDYRDQKWVEFALKEWGEVFRQLPRIDAVLVPCGDPGHTPARPLMALVEKQAANLRRYHPNAQMWVAPQGFTQPELDEFLAIVATKPKWLNGVVYGPQTRIPLAELRKKIPAEYPIRHYPDITHTRSAQYPVPDWDVAFALTEGREPVNPRPLDQAHIFRLTNPLTIGFIAYSEGCNDDVNKTIWSALGWDSKTDVFEALRQYARYFIGPDFEYSFAQGLLALERNWRGPAMANEGIDRTLEQFRAMERTATPPVKLNWRFQQALYRAYYDAWVRQRLIYETTLERRALDWLRKAPQIGSLTAMRLAEEELDRALTDPTAPELRNRISELADALFNSIRMQLTVERHGAIAVGRGANLDLADEPLNNRLWLKDSFAAIRSLAEERDRLSRLARVVDWKNPGPGGFYDDLGNAAAQPHLVKGQGFDQDPMFFSTPLSHFEPDRRRPKSWWDQALALYDQPLVMRYENLDPQAQYRLRAVYGGRQMRLAADGIEVHPYLDRPYEVLEFDIPQETTRDGKLELVWTHPAGVGGAGRGNQVAEVWLMRK